MVTRTHARARTHANPSPSWSQNSDFGAAALPARSNPGRVRRRCPYRVSTFDVEAVPSHAGRFPIFSRLSVLATLSVWVFPHSAIGNRRGAARRYTTHDNAYVHAAPHPRLLTYLRAIPLA